MLSVEENRALKHRETSLRSISLKLDYPDEVKMFLSSSLALKLLFIALIIMSTNVLFVLCF